MTIFRSKFQTINGKLNWLLVEVGIVNRKVGVLMSQVEDLTTAVAAISAAVDGEIARVEKVIADLTAAGSSDPAVAKAIEDLKASTTKLDNERAAPPA